MKYCRKASSYYIIRRPPFATHQGQVFCRYTCFVLAPPFAFITLDWRASATRLFVRRWQLVSRPARPSRGRVACVICPPSITVCNEVRIRDRANLLVLQPCDVWGRGMYAHADHISVDNSRQKSKMREAIASTTRKATCRSNSGCFLGLSLGPNCLPEVVARSSSRG